VNEGESTAAKDLEMTKSEENRLLKPDEVVAMDSEPPAIGEGTSGAPVNVLTEPLRAPPGFFPHSRIQLKDKPKEILKDVNPTFADK